MFVSEKISKKIERLFLVKNLKSIYLKNKVKNDV